MLQVLITSADCRLHDKGAKPLSCANAHGVWGNAPFCASKRLYLTELVCSQFHCCVKHNVRLFGLDCSYLPSFKLTEKSMASSNQLSPSESQQQVRTLVPFTYDQDGKLCVDTTRKEIMLTTPMTSLT